jgi:hypothetical protein
LLYPWPIRKQGAMQVSQEARIDDHRRCHEIEVTLLSAARALPAKASTGSEVFVAQRMQEISQLQAAQLANHQLSPEVVTNRLKQEYAGLQDSDKQALEARGVEADVKQMQNIINVMERVRISHT